MFFLDKLFATFKACFLCNAFGRAGQKEMGDRIYFFNRCTADDRLTSLKTR